MTNIIKVTIINMKYACSLAQTGGKHYFEKELNSTFLLTIKILRKLFDPLEQTCIFQFFCTLNLQSQLHCNCTVLAMVKFIKKN